ncbi:hypothetical protein [Polymorphospora rubra]|uniref:hypothetical protein n=1 Tax=Polymorphospora rubra TaxID=338584 RepID=UPI0033E87114
MQPPVSKQRKPFISRYSALLSWAVWFGSAVWTVSIALERAPHETVDEWQDLLFILVTAVLLPVLFVLTDHTRAVNGRSRLPFLFYGFTLLALINFSTEAVRWGQEAGITDLQGSEHFAAFLVFMMGSGLGTFMLWSHYSHLREDRKRETAAEEPASP